MQAIVLRLEAFILPHWSQVWLMELLQWFLDNASQKPVLNDCVFYTEKQSEPAQDFAEDRKLTTIWVCVSEVDVLIIN